jgi:two-component system, sensor histidine kinase
VASASGISVLNVEDYAASREATTELLRDEGFDVVEASSGRDAIEAVSRLHPQLVLLDVRLPDMSGHEVCRRIKSDPLTSSTPILEISGAFSEGRDKVHGLENGADAYLVKPIEPRELVATIRALLRMEQTTREAAQAASIAKDEFLAVVSHELRTPLASMLGWACLLKEKKLDETMIARAIDTIERSARAQQKIIEDLLDASRISTGMLCLDKRQVALAPLIDAAIDTLQPLARTKAIEIKARYESPGERVFCDPDRLQQVVCNLLSNAVKFTPPNGRITVRVEACEDQVRIDVTDTGPGISPELLPFIFERFRQGDLSVDKRKCGLGLGLSIARELVELHGGRLIAQNNGDRLGSTFTVILPQSTGHQNAPATELRVPRARSGVRRLFRRFSFVPH